MSVQKVEHKRTWHERRTRMMIWSAGLDDETKHWCCSSDRNVEEQGLGEAEEVGFENTNCELSVLMIDRI